MTISDSASGIGTDDTLDPTEGMEAPTNLGEDSGADPGTIGDPSDYGDTDDMGETSGLGGTSEMGDPSFRGSDVDRGQDY
jgi:hypothetical protein